jgi:hypothetical protein
MSKFLNMTLEPLKTDRHKNLFNDVHLKSVSVIWIGVQAEIRKILREILPFKFCLPFQQFTT